MTIAHQKIAAKILLFVSGLFMVAILLLPVQGFSANNTNNANTGANSNNAANTNEAANYDTKIDDFHNLLKIDSFPELILLFTRGFLILIGVVAVMVIIYGGFRMVLSAGNSEGVTAGKQAVIWAVAGLAVALLAYSLVSILENLLSK